MPLPDLVLVHGGEHAADCWDLVVADLRCQAPELRRTSSSNTGRVWFSARDSPTLRLPRLGASTMGENEIPGAVAERPATVTSPRCASPVTGFSILMTSAPQSASTAPAEGTKVNCATSRTRTLSSASACHPYLINDRAMTSRWTSVAPSPSRLTRRSRNQRSSGSSVEMPRAPWIWMHRSSTL
jgi:hypothetical protein